MEATTEDFLEWLGIGAAGGAAIGTGTVIAAAPLLLLMGTPAGPIIAIGAVAGAVGGGYIGASVKGQAEGSILLVPAKLEKMSENCKTLGRAPFEDPWSDGK